MIRPHLRSVVPNDPPSRRAPAPVLPRACPSNPDFAAHRFLALVLALIHALITSACAADAEPDLRPEDLPHLPALEPDRALQSFQVRPGFRLELAAHEPQIFDPIALSFDELGRAYVVEMRDYSERRPERLGRIRRLEDRDADGHFETSSVFLDDLPWPTAVLCWDGGVFIGSTPDLLFARDQDGDGRADVRETVFTGFASDYAPFATNKLNVQALMNSFQWGIDGRVHGAASFSAGKVRLVDSDFTRAWRSRFARSQALLNPGGPSPAAEPRESAAALDLRGRDFSFDPRQLELRPETGGGQYGMCFDDTGRKFLCSNSDHLQLVRYDALYATRDLAYPLPAARVSIAADGPAAEVFRTSPEEPWRVIRTRWRVTGLVQGLIEGGGRSSGYFTSATGLTLYRGDAYGSETLGDAFVADCGSNLIHRKKLRPRGIDLVGERPADESHREFLTSSDTWFRPVQFANAPDGCLWILDMYREIIEHPWSLPPNLKRLLDLNSGNNRGRLYRITPENTTLRRKVDLASADTPALIATLAHPNGWHRDTASRLLLERADPAALPLLRSTLLNSPNDLARLHALGILDRFGACTDADLASALLASAEPVRRRAIRLVEEAHARQPLPSLLIEPLARLVHDTATVRFQLALSLAVLDHPDRSRLLAQLVVSARQHPGEEPILAAALGGVRDHADALFLQAPLPALAEWIGRRNRDPEVHATLRHLATLPSGPAALDLALHLANGLAFAGNSLARSDSTDSLRSLRDFALETALRLARQAGSVSSPSAPSAANLTLASTALELLSRWGRPEPLQQLAGTWPDSAPAPLQRSWVETLARWDEPWATAAIERHWPNLPSDARQAYLELLLRRPRGPLQVLEALESNRIRPQDLATTQLAALRSHADPVTRRRALALLGAPAASRTEALAVALPALDLKGDPTRGLAVHTAQCAPCHRLAGQGHAVGPDLETVRSQSRERLLVAIIDPHREVAPNFLATTVETRDGESLSGILASESASELVLQQASGIQTRLRRSDVQSIGTDGRSLMPEGFEATLKPQELADLIALLIEGPPATRP